jgi:hypothetical protein
VEQDVCANLTEPVLSLWQRLQTLDGGISGQFEAESPSNENSVAEDRSLVLRMLCEEIAKLPDIRLRERLLTELLEGNTLLYAQGVQALSDAGAQSVAGALQRRAIKAYGVQDGSA